MFWINEHKNIQFIHFVNVLLHPIYRMTQKDHGLISMMELVKVSDKCVLSIVRNIAFEEVETNTSLLD